MKSMLKRHRPFSTVATIAICLTISGTGLTAQDAIPTPRPEPVDKILGPAPSSESLIGLLGGVSYNMHSGEFTIVENELECCRFDGANGLGLTAALKLFYPLSSDGPYFVGARAGYEMHDASFEGDREELPILGQGNEVESAFFTNELDAGLPALTLQPFFSYRILPTALFISTGPSLQYYVSSELTKTHSIDEPGGVEFLDGTTAFEITDVTVSSLATTTFAWVIGLDLAVPISSPISLGAEALYRVPITRLATDEQWSVSNMIGSIGVYYQL